MEYRFDIEQNTEKWDNIKLGIFSASTCPELLMDKNTKGYTGLINRIVEERITGKKCESKSFQGNSFTDRGHEFEPLAIENYEFNYLKSVKKVGVVIKNEWCLCSPDGLIGSNELIQVKCPIFNTQLEYLETKKIPTNYFKQIQFELYVCEDRDINIFYSFHPNLPPLEIEVKRDDEMQELINNRLKKAIQEVEEKINNIQCLII